ncbi:hypothetical protein FBZ84_101299 [Azospirillum baldaniorum]|uniref:hypothetical protein n=1 Tax=Azospirillum baldaniorum TaxID=1064539 RepID=UPI0011A3D4F4|nr:hypothetical protein [Azospirillum baldaniorum]TWA72029.1 hypothetical protein FBZ84_101299 [Azospirillum baldaniorum]
MSVQTFNPTDLSQSTANWAVAQRIVGPFAPHAQVSPDLTIALDPGYLLNGTTLTEVKAQVVGPFAPPSSGFRIDRVVVDRTTGAASVVAGTANSLTPPAIPSGTLPVARVFTESTTESIDNSVIVDERALTDQTPLQTSVICRAHLGGTNQSIPLNSSFSVNFSTTTFDLGNSFDATNHRFQPKTPGYYAIQANLEYRNLTSGAIIYAYLYKNNATHAMHGIDSNAANYVCSVGVCDIIYLNGTSDYVDVRGWCTTGSSPYLQGGQTYTWFTAAKVG